MAKKRYTTSNRGERRNAYAQDLASGFVHAVPPLRGLAARRKLTGPNDLLPRWRAGLRGLETSHLWQDVEGDWMGVVMRTGEQPWEVAIGTAARNGRIFAPLETRVLSSIIDVPDGLHRV